MNITRRATIALTAAALLQAMPVAAQDSFPSKPIRWVIGTAAGGGSDIVARTIAAQLSQQLGQQVIVDNKPGGGTTIAADLVARAPADGYTILTADVGTLVFNTALFKKLPYTPTKDLAPVGTLAQFPLLLAVGANSEFKDAKSLVEAIRRNPGKLTYGSAGVGSPHHLAMEMLKDQAKLFITHVPYRGAAPAVQDTVGGMIPLMVVDTASGMQMIKAGRMKVLATFTRGRVASLPEVPTLMELGLTQIEAASWQGMVAPAGTPKEIVAKLSNELQKAINSPSVQGRLRDLGLEPLPSTQAEMGERWAKDDKVWPQLIRTRGITLD